MQTTKQAAAPADAQSFSLPILMIFGSFGMAILINVLWTYLSGWTCAAAHLALVMFAVGCMAAQKHKMLKDAACHRGKPPVFHGDLDSITHHDRPESGPVTLMHFTTDDYGNSMSSRPADHLFRFRSWYTAQRHDNAKLYVEVESVLGSNELPLSAVFEIGHVPGSAPAVQCMHFWFNSDEKAATIYRRGDDYLFVPDIPGAIRQQSLVDGTPAWVLSQ